MSDFYFESEPYSAAELLPWDVEVDRKTDHLAFVNQQADLKILVLSPDEARRLVGSNDGCWVAQLSDLRHGSSREPSIIAVEESEVDMIASLEDLLQRGAHEDDDFLRALNQLEAAGLVVESVSDVAAEYAMSGMDTADRVRAYLRFGAGRHGKPRLSDGASPSDQLLDALVRQGLRESEAVAELSLLQVSSRSPGTVQTGCQQKSDQKALALRHQGTG